MADQRIVEMQLANGATALATVRAVDGAGAVKTSTLEKFDFEEITRTLEGIADSIKEALRSAAPSKVSVELGLELAMKAGKLTGLIVEGEGKGSLSVTMEWERDALDA